MKTRLLIVGLLLMISSCSPSVDYGEIVANWRPGLDASQDMAASCDRLLAAIDTAISSGVDSELFDEILSIQEAVEHTQGELAAWQPPADAAAYKQSLVELQTITSDVITQWMNDEINLQYAPEYLGGECSKLEGIRSEMRVDLIEAGVPEDQVP